MWTLTDFRRKLLRFDRPNNPSYKISNIQKYYSNFLDWDKTRAAGPKLANSCHRPIYNIKYPLVYEERSTTPPIYEAHHTLGNTRFLLLLLVLGTTFVMMASTVSRL